MQLSFQEWFIWLTLMQLVFDNVELFIEQIELLLMTLNEFRLDVWIKDVTLNCCIAILVIDQRYVLLLAVVIIVIRIVDLWEVKLLEGFWVQEHCSFVKLIFVVRLVTLVLIAPFIFFQEAFRLFIWNRVHLLICDISVGYIIIHVDNSYLLLLLRAVVIAAASLFILLESTLWYIHNQRGLARENHNLRRVVMLELYFWQDLLNYGVGSLLFSLATYVIDVCLTVRIFNHLCGLDWFLLHLTGTLWLSFTWRTSGLKFFVSIDRSLHLI